MRANCFILSVFLFALQMISAQTAADYYLHLQTGNYLVFHTQVSQVGWEPRTVRKSIVGTDTISGQEYFIQESREILDSTPSVSYVFEIFWLRKDSLGNILIGARSLTESANLDSAIIYNSQSPFFHNEFLTLGYSQKYLFNSISFQDTVISISETVSTTAGIFTNCIKIRQTQVDTLGTTVRLEYVYYTFGIGEVMRKTEIPVVNTVDLTQYNILTSVDEENKVTIPTGFTLHQNYPNPFNPSTNITYQIDANSFITLEVYDILGRKVTTLVNEEKSSGKYNVKFNADKLSGGIYLYTLRTKDFVQTKKMILIK